MRAAPTDVRTRYTYSHRLNAVYLIYGTVLQLVLISVMRADEVYRSHDVASVNSDSYLEIEVFC